MYFWFYTAIVVILLSILFFLYNWRITMANCDNCRFGHWEETRFNNYDFVCDKEQKVSNWDFECKFFQTYEDIPKFCFENKCENGYPKEVTMRVEDFENINPNDTFVVEKTYYVDNNLYNIELRKVDIND